MRLFPHPFWVQGLLKDLMYVFRMTKATQNCTVRYSLWGTTGRLAFTDGWITQITGKNG